MLSSSLDRTGLSQSSALSTWPLVKPILLRRDPGLTNLLIVRPTINQQQAIAGNLILLALFHQALHGHSHKGCASCKVELYLVSIHQDGPSPLLDLLDFVKAAERVSHFQIMNRPLEVGTFNSLPGPRACFFSAYDQRKVRIHFFQSRIQHARRRSYAHFWCMERFEKAAYPVG